MPYRTPYGASTINTACPNNLTCMKNSGWHIAPVTHMKPCMQLGTSVHVHQSPVDCMISSGRRYEKLRVFRKPYFDLMIWKVSNSSTSYRIGVQVWQARLPYCSRASPASLDARVTQISYGGYLLSRQATILVSNLGTSRLCGPITPCRYPTEGVYYSTT